MNIRVTYHGKSDGSDVYYFTSMLARIAHRRFGTMMVMKVCTYVFVCTLHMLVLPTLILAADSVEVAVATVDGSLLPPQDDFSGIVVDVSYCENIDEWLTDKTGWNFPGEWESNITPHIGIITEPSTDVEIALGFGLKIKAPITDHLSPFIYGITGPYYSTLETNEQSTQFNFASFGGYGVEYMLDETYALTLSRSIRHVSNGSIRSPNDGIDTNSFALGLIIKN